MEYTLHGHAFAFGRFGYRGVMIDVARNFKPKTWIFKIMDIMALYKLNVLHLHLTDDEGWRLEIPGIPELTEVEYLLLSANVLYRSICHRGRVSFAKCKRLV